MKQQHREKGFGGLVAILVMAGVLLVLASALIPNIVLEKRVSTETSAAQQLAGLNSGEFAAAQIYGLYLPPAQLTGTLASPIKCSNPMLASGAVVQPPNGYVMTFTPGAGQTSTASNCSSVSNGMNAYTINLDPPNPILAQRHFYTDQTQIIRFNDSRPAGPTDLAYAVSTPISAILTVSGATSPTPAPIPPATGGPGTYSVSATSNANGPMTGSIVVNADGSFSGTLSNSTNCNVSGNITASGSGSSINFAGGGGCDWGGSDFTGGAQDQSGFSFNGVQNNCGGCGNTMILAGTQ